MNQHQYELNYNNEASYWWFVGRRRMVRGLIEKYILQKNGLKFLDAGCGTGIVMQDLSTLAEPWGVDISPDAIEYCKSRDLKNLVLNNLTSGLPFPDETFDFITILGVLVMLDNDSAALRELFRVLKKGGVLVSDEAAFDMLFSSHNRNVGAIRRYSKPRIKALLGSAGFRILKASYWNFFTLPIFIFVKAMDMINPRLSRKFYNMEIKPPALLNRFLILGLELEYKLVSFCGIPFGASVITVAQKV